MIKTYNPNHCISNIYYGNTVYKNMMYITIKESEKYKIYENKQYNETCEWLDKYLLKKK